MEMVVVATTLGSLTRHHVDAIVGYQSLEDLAKELDLGDDDDWGADDF